MTIQSINSVVIIGAGNAAWHLANQLKRAGINILQIYNRTAQNGIALANAIGCEYIDTFQKINPFADLFIISVSDDHVAEVIYQSQLEGKFLVHTAGSVDMDVFNGFTNKYGVFYPFQTLKKEVDLLTGKIPVCIEANNNYLFSLLNKLAFQITDQVYHLNSSERSIVHLAGVMANNFVNHLIGLSYQLLENNNIKREILFPLISETVQKALVEDPVAIQTGPALRNNSGIIKKHLEMLNKNDDLRRIYKIVSENILRVHSDKS